MRDSPGFLRAFVSGDPGVRRAGVGPESLHNRHSVNGLLGLDVASLIQGVVDYSNSSACRTRFACVGVGHVGEPRRCPFKECFDGPQLELRVSERRVMV